MASGLAGSVHGACVPLGCPQAPYVKTPVDEVSGTAAAVHIERYANIEAWMKSRFIAPLLFG